MERPEQSGKLSIKDKILLSVAGTSLGVTGGSLITVIVGMERHSEKLVDMGADIGSLSVIGWVVPILVKNFSEILRDHSLDSNTPIINNNSESETSKTGRGSF